MRRLVFLLVVAGLAAPAVAHDYWLAPTTFVSPKDVDVGVHLLVGEHLVSQEDRTHEAQRTPRIDLFHGSVKTDLIPSAIEGAMPAFNFSLKGAGGHLLVVDRVPAMVELEAARFEKYIQTEGHKGIIEERARRGESAKPGRERFRRNLKALFQIGAARDTTFGIDTGQTIELVPEQHPVFAAIGDTITFRLTFRDKPLANHHVVALSKGSGSVAVVHTDEYTTDADGRVKVKIDRHGQWLIRGVNMIRCETECDAVEWDSYWFSYAFANPASAKPKSPAGIPMIAVIGGAAGAVFLAVLGFVLVRRRSRTSR